MRHSVRVCVFVNEEKRERLLEQSWYMSGLFVCFKLKKFGPQVPCLLGCLPSDLPHAYSGEEMLLSICNDPLFSGKPRLCAYVFVCMSVCVSHVYMARVPRRTSGEHN